MEPTNGKKNGKAGRTGRPRTEFDPTWSAALIEHMAVGLSFESFGAKIGHHSEFLYEQLKRSSDFANAKKIGEARSRLFWELEGISGMRMGKDFNAAVWIFNMKNRFGWTDRTELTGKDGTALFDGIVYKVWSVNPAGKLEESVPG